MYCRNLKRTTEERRILKPASYVITIVLIPTRLCLYEYQIATYMSDNLQFHPHFF